MTDVYTMNKKIQGTLEFSILPFYYPSIEFWLFLSKLSHFRKTTAPETYHQKLLDMEKIYTVYSQVAAAAAAKSLQSCPTLCNPIDGSPPGSPVPGILQARTLEWVTISFSNV